MYHLHVYVVDIWLLRMHSSQDLAERKSGIISVILMIHEEPAESILDQKYPDV